jgi:hypothetical protein
VTARHFLYIVAAAQGVLLVALIILIVLNRWVRVRRRAHVHPKKVILDRAMQSWAAGKGPVGTVIERLSRVPVPVAIDALVAWSARVPAERWQELARSLERQRWARGVRAEARSARWWRRLECARFLSVAALPGDTARLLRLMADPHPAVHIAAVATLERVDSPALISAAVGRLTEVSPTVQAYYAGMLRRSRPLVVGLLAKRLEQTDGPGVAALLEFAVRLREPSLRERLTSFATHQDPEVRAQAARALGHYPHQASVDALRRLAVDAAWPVRAQAARALGMIADPTTLPQVRQLLRDPEWWVRLRAGLALMRFGSPGRDMLVAEDIGPHAEARAVAGLVLGLSSQALAEFAT